MDPNNPNNPAAPTPITPSAQPQVDPVVSTTPSINDIPVAPAAPNPAIDVPAPVMDTPPAALSVPAMPPIDPAPPVMPSMPDPVVSAPAPVMPVPEMQVTSEAQVMPPVQEQPIPAVDPVPTWPPPEAPLQPNLTPPPASSSVDLSSINVQPDNAPTDLSHLAAALGVPGQQTPVAPAPSAAPQSLPAEGTAATSVVAASPKMSKKLLIVGGIILLVAVTIASAYFILGIGQPAPDTTSLPAQTQLTAPPRSTVTPTPLPVSESPSTLGGVSGATESAQIATSSAQTTGTSVFDRRKTQ